jgi:hypothetical protein
MHRSVTWRAATVVLAVVVCGMAGAGIVGASFAGAAEAKSSSGSSPAKCGADDTPETGLQGDVPMAEQQSGRAAQGYNCGLAVLAHVGGVAADGINDMAWSGDCAYVKAPNSTGIVVLDVSKPAAPVVSQTLTLPAAITSENLHAVTTKKRALLVAALLGPNPRGQGPNAVDVWDVRDCTHPRLVGTVTSPGNVHNIELNEDATKIYGSLPLQVIDITDLSDPSSWKVTDFQCEVAKQAKPGFTGFEFSQTAFALDRPECANQLAHEFAFNKAGTRMYIGGQLPASLGETADPQGRHWDTEQYFYVVDLTASPPKIISTISGAGHGARRVTINGKPFILHSNENVGSEWNGCHTDAELPLQGAAQADLTDVSNEKKPKTVSKLALTINDRANCASEVSSGVKSSVHYHEVDNSDDTTFAMVSMGNAGLRIFDVRNPEQPREVAYFNAGQITKADGTTTLDATLTHPHYDARTGNLWVNSHGGFWVLELEPQVRKTLGLPARPNEYPSGRAARPADLN